MSTTLCAIGALAIIVLVVILFIFKRSVLKKWLIEAVTLAEKEIGSGRGQEKLMLVHSRLVQAFPVVGKFLPFSIFSKMVDAALVIMREKLKEEE